MRLWLLLAGLAWLAAPEAAPWGSDDVGPAASGCQVPPPHAGPGGCPARLPEGGSCELRCDEGYEASEVLRCEGGRLTSATCEPRPCGVGPDAAPVNGTIGNCPPRLPSGAACQPDCDENYTAIRNFSCSLGRLSPGACARCGPGFEEEGWACKACPAGRFTPVSGPDPCQPCPEHADSEPGASGLRDCRCGEGFIAVLQDGSANLLQRCRRPYPCDLRNFLDERNLTPGGPNSLMLGTCRGFAQVHARSDAGDLMPSGARCDLGCGEGLAPQYQANFFNNVDTSIECRDSEIISTLVSGIWCSESSFEIPPLVFLGTVVVAVVVGGLRLEVRQFRFEHRALRELAVRPSAVAQQGPPANPRKSKDA